MRWRFQTFLLWKGIIYLEYMRLDAFREEGDEPQYQMQSIPAPLYTWDSLWNTILAEFRCYGYAQKTPRRGWNGKRRKFSRMGRSMWGWGPALLVKSVGGKWVYLGEHRSVLVFWQPTPFYCYFSEEESLACSKPSAGPWNIPCIQWKDRKGRGCNKWNFYYLYAISDPDVIPL